MSPTWPSGSPRRPRRARRAGPYGHYREPELAHENVEGLRFRDAAVALTATPPRADVAALREQGLDDLAISDALHATAFFNWANRLMLSLGEPDES
ncbi:hypothetical protein [Nonomuraea sp. NPDC003804]|uniref:hypothetical protein n=1 Tax=Nonomuraea sp. NPDC003804 TaxID=3154547 RepID=UPI0033A45505